MPAVALNRSTGTITGRSGIIFPIVAESPNSMPYHSWTENDQNPSCKWFPDAKLCFFRLMKNTNISSKWCNVNHQYDIHIFQ